LKAFLSLTSNFFLSKNEFEFIFCSKYIFTTDGVKHLEKNTQMRVSLKLREQRLFCCDQHFDQRQEGITLELLLFSLL